MWQPVGGDSVKAWVNFDGDSCAATCPIRSSYNVSSVQRISTGQYRVNFINSLPDNLYSTFTSYTNANSTYFGQLGTTYNEFTSSVTVQSRDAANSNNDRNGISVLVVR